jgi:spore coat protein U-like protein
MHCKRLTFAFTVAALVAVAAGPLTAGSKSQPIRGPGTAFCTLAGPPLEVGTYDPQRVAPVLATVAWQFVCVGSDPRPQNFTLHGHSAGDVTFFMTNTRGDRLAYEICVDPACTEPLGTGIGNLNPAVRPATAAASGELAGSLVFYATVPAGQSVPAGSYQGALTVTIDF